MSMLMNVELTMSSLEVAKLTGKRHDHVMRDIRKMLDEIGAHEKSSQYKDSTGRLLPALLLDKDEALCLVSGYNTKMRMAIIKRWNELESNNQLAIPNFNDPVQAARAWADAQEEKMKAVALMHKAEEKSAALESFFTIGMTVAAFCKGLNGVNTQKVNQFLVSKRWLYSSGRGWRVASYARDRYLTEKVGDVDGPNGKLSTYRQELLKEGARKLFKMYINGEMPMKKNWDGKYSHDKLTQNDAAVALLD